MKNYNDITVEQVILSTKKVANYKKTPKIRQYYLVANFFGRQVSCPTVVRMAWSRVLWVNVNTNNRKRGKVE